MFFLGLSKVFDDLSVIWWFCQLKQFNTKREKNNKLGKGLFLERLGGGSFIFQG
jgi:hypothetical protein